MIETTAKIISERVPRSWNAAKIGQKRQARVVYDKDSRCAVGAREHLASDAEGFYALAPMRLIKPPFTEQEIVAKEKKSSDVEIV
jgi:hypothetical protein